MDQDTSRGSVSPVVVCGGGIGGAFVARKFWSSKLITNDPEFVWTPRLCEILRGPESRVHKSIMRVHRDTSVAAVRSVDPVEKKVVTADGVVLYQKLVLATGSSPGMSVPGVEAHTLPFYSLKNALLVRNVIRQRIPDSAIVVGAGPTGVELANELRVIGVKNISIIHGANHILPMYSKTVRDYAVRKMEKAGIHILSDAWVKRVIEGAVVTTAKGGEEETEREAEIVLWTGGTQANTVPGIPVNEQTGSRKPGFATNEFLQIPEFPDVFAIGDCRKPLGDSPMTAAAAKQEAQCVTENVQRSLKSASPVLKKFSFTNKGNFLTLGDETYVDSAIKLHGWLGSTLRNNYYRFAMWEYGV